MSIVIDGLSHIYHENTALQTAALEGVSLSIEKGSWTSFIGHTGSGKSTLAQHLNALLRPTSGRVVVDGTVVVPEGKRDKTDLRQIRRKVGLVFQYPEQQLFEETVRAELAFAPRNYGLPEEEVQRRVDDALEHRELIKIAVLKNCLYDVRDLSDTLSARTGSDCVQTIGRKFVLYRASKKDPKIVLPK